MSMNSIGVLTQINAARRKQAPTFLFFHKVKIGGQHANIESYRFGDFRCNLGFGIDLVGTGRLGVPGDRNALNLGCQLDGLF
jgi:hypothetical protein